VGFRVWSGGDRWGLGFGLGSKVQARKGGERRERKRRRRRETETKGKEVGGLFL
jgi:hypothetical protein